MLRLIKSEEKLSMSLAIRDICEIKCYEEIRVKVRQIAMKIGEIAYTMKILNLHTEDNIKLVYSYYNSILTSNKDIKTSKRKTKLTLGQFDLNLAFLFIQLQYLSVILFDSGEHVHINAEEWVLHIVRSASISILEGNSGCVENMLFPALASYLSIDKYLIFLEQLRAFTKSEYKDLGYIYMTWLDALEEYKCNCLEDCFWHLDQFLNDSKEELDLFSKIFVAEKAVGLGIIILNSIKNKEESILLPKTLLKHFKLNKVGKEVYIFNTFKHKGYSENEEKEIRKALEEILINVIESASNYFSEESCELAFTYIQQLLIALYLDAKTEIESLRKLSIMIAQKTQLISEHFMIKEKLSVWKMYQEQYKYALKNEIDNERESPFKDIIVVKLEHGNPPNIGKLRNEEIKESKQIAIHINIYKALKEKRLSENKRKKFDIDKYELSEKMRSLGFNVPEKINYSNKIVNERYKLVQSIKDLHMIIVNTFFSTAILNPLDAHYIFDMLEKVNKLYISSINMFGLLIETNKKEDTEEIEESIEQIKEQLIAWKANKFMPDNEYIEKKKQLYRLKWQQHKQRLKQQEQTKLKKIKKQEYSEHKAKTKVLGIQI